MPSLAFSCSIEPNKFNEPHTSTAKYTLPFGSCVFYVSFVGKFSVFFLLSFSISLWVELDSRNENVSNAVARFHGAFVADNDRGWMNATTHTRHNVLTLCHATATTLKASTTPQTKLIEQPKSIDWLLTHIYDVILCRINTNSQPHWMQPHVENTHNEMNVS